MRISDWSSDVCSSDLNLLAETWFVSKPMKQYTHAELADIASKLGSWQLVPAGTEGYRTAEVTLGGVDTREVSSKTMESLKSPGLYFIGEVLEDRKSTRLNSSH